MTPSGCYDKCYFVDYYAPDQVAGRPKRAYFHVIYQGDFMLKAEQSIPKGSKMFSVHAYPYMDEDDQTMVWSRNRGLCEVEQWQ